MIALASVLAVILGLVHLSDSTPGFYPPVVIEGDGETCFTGEERRVQRNRTYSDILALLNVNPCGPGWTKVAFLNMSNATEQCPGSWVVVSDGEKKLCARQEFLQEASCDSVYFPTGVEYTQVCGRILGHQYASTDGFGYRSQPMPIDSPYVDGVSITYGNPRKHIWSFASAFAEDHPIRDTHCPCDSFSSVTTPPFVGDNYFCETGFTVGPAEGLGVDPLWDGEGCAVSSCCSFNSPPWFSVDLPAPTTDQIEVRICIDEPTTSDEPTTGEDVFVELLELYVK